MYKIMSSVLALGLLVGCSENTPTKVDSESSKNIVEETTPLEAPASTVSSSNSELASYGTTMSGYTKLLSQSMNDISTLTGEAGENPAIILTEDWKMEVALSLTVMEKAIDSIRAVTPPEEMEEIHTLTLKAMDEYEFVVDNFPKAIDTMNVDLITQCSSAMVAGTDYITQATSLMDEMGY